MEMDNMFQKSGSKVLYIGYYSGKIFIINPKRKKKTQTDISS